MWIFFSLDNMLWMGAALLVGLIALWGFPQRHWFIKVAWVSFFIYGVMLLKFTWGPLDTIGGETPLLWVFFPDRPDLNLLITHWILNFLLFFPLGVYAVVTFNLHQRRTVYWILLVIGSPFVIEGVQFILGWLIPHYSLHVFAWDDLWWNSLGVLFGFFFAIAGIRLTRLPTGVSL